MSCRLTQPLPLSALAWPRHGGHFEPNPLGDLRFPLGFKLSVHATLDWIGCCAASKTSKHIIMLYHSPLLRCNFDGLHDRTPCDTVAILQRVVLTCTLTVHISRLVQHGAPQTMLLPHRLKLLCHYCVS